MAHEFAHTAKYGRHGGLTGFLHAYLLHGYAHAALEQEAVRKTQR